MADYEPKQTEVILRVTDLGASLQYNKLRLTTEPVGDMFISVAINPEHVQTREDGTRVFTKDGIRFVLKGLLASLMIDVDKGDF